MKATLYSVVFTVLIAIQGHSLAQNLTMAAETALDGPKMLEELPGAGSGWQFGYLRASVHEQMFRDGSRIVHEPSWLSEGSPLSQEDIKSFRVTFESRFESAPLSIDDRLFHWHSAVKELNRIASEMHGDRQFLLCMSLARLWDQGAPYALKAQLAHGPLYEPRPGSIAPKQDWIAQFDVSVLRPLVVDRVQPYTEIDIVWLAENAGTERSELMELLENRSAIRSLLDAQDQYASAVLIGDRLMKDEDEPWKTPYWGLTRFAAERWQDISERIRAIDPKLDTTRSEIRALASRWIRVRAPRQGG